MLLKDKVVLVTGAGRGIGRGISQALAEEGASVICTDIDSENIQTTLSMVKEIGYPALGLIADVRDRKAIEDALQVTLDKFGRLDGLVTNAGVIRMNNALETNLEDYQYMLDVNVLGLFQCCQLAAKVMASQESGGAIVNMSSSCGKVGYPNMFAYNSTKAAVISITRNLAEEWADKNINVNAVCPGAVATPMLKSISAWRAEAKGVDPEEEYDSYTAEQLGRHIKPIEVGRVIAFLLSEYAVIIRGQSINVDAGHTPY